jgi:hypothetical protein
MALEWALVSEAPETSRALAIAAGDEVIVLERRSEDTARLYLHGFGLDGSGVFGPVLVGEAEDGDVALTPAGDVVAVTSGLASSSLSWWSAQGDPFGQIELLAQGGPMSGLAVLAPTDDTLIVAGTAQATEQAVLQGRSPAGDIAWEHLGDHDVVLALALAPTLGILALTANPFIEGFESFVEAYALNGTPLWSVPAGSEAGNFNESIAPYALTEDGAGGAVVLGSHATVRAPVSHAASVIRFAEGDTLWSVQAPHLPETDFPGEGGLVRVGERLVTISGYGRPTLSVHDLDGSVLCQQWLGDAEAALRVLAVRPTADGFVAAGEWAATGQPPHAWVASFAEPG